MNIPNIYLEDVVPKWDPQKKHVPRSILILGNGFDIDLGMKTKYSQFADSPFWPFHENITFEEDSLPYFLNNSKNQVDTWFDLEELLANYACRETKLSSDKVKQAKEDFSTLTKALKLYLEKQEDEFVQMMKSLTHTRRVKPAHYVLQYFQRKEIKSIYTFNYTNVYRIANQIILNFNDDFNYVHGSTKEDNIILGTGDQRNLNDEYFEFYKSASPLYESNNLVEDLNDADEVYIFGHSLGRNDHDYFSEFFKMASKTVHRPFAPGKIKVRIFTYDERSEIEIKKQLMRLTDNHLIGLFAHCDCRILKTDLKHQSDWMMHEELL